MELHSEDHGSLRPSSSSGRQLPRNLWVQSDNTVQELNNSLAGSTRINFSDADFDRTWHHHLPVGHRHDGLLPFEVGVALVGILKSRESILLIYTRFLESNMKYLVRSG